MKNLFIFFFAFTACQSDKYSSYQIDYETKAKIDSLIENGEIPRYRGLNVAYMTSLESESDSLQEPDIINRLDNLEREGLIISVRCGCEFKNDSIVVAGGLFYSGGQGFEVILTKNVFSGEIVLVTNNSDLKAKTTDKYFLNDITLKSKFAKMGLVRPPEFNLGSSLQGTVILISQPFYQKIENIGIKRQISIRIYFTCTVDEVGFL
jgi:hypothetical protein